MEKYQVFSSPYVCVGIQALTCCLELLDRKLCSTGCSGKKKLEWVHFAQDKYSQDK